MNLSEPQIEVIKRLQEGWEMSTSWTAIGYTKIRNNITLQKNGLGKGGESFHDTRLSTVHALKRRGLIVVSEERHPFGQIWVLTEKGMALQSLATTARNENDK